MPYDDEFNAINWINQSIDYPFSEEELKPVRDFSLIWNLFENRVCNRHFNETDIRKLISDYSISKEDFTQCLDYFVDRYVFQQNSLELFNKLFDFRNTPRRKFVKKVLNGQLTSDEDIILGCILIVHRYRNNLFHGNKEILMITHQRNNLITGAKVLTTFMEKIQLRF
jgi:hypothetical protein